MKRAFPIYKKKGWMSWSTGKDSAFALYELMSHSDLQITGLLTTVTESYNRVSMHAVRKELLELQANALNLPLYQVRIPPVCTNEVYETRMNEAIMEAQATGATFIGFGDLFLEDVRKYRIDLLSNSGIEPIFPLWLRSTRDLAYSMINSGLKAILTCVDPRKIPVSFAGREYDEALLAELPPGVDPCGENGEFHTFVYDGPMFQQRINIEVGESVTRDGFVFADIRELRGHTP